MRSCFTILTTFSHGLASSDIVCDGYLYNKNPGAFMSLRVPKNAEVAKCMTKYEGTLSSVST